MDFFRYKTLPKTQQFPFPLSQKIFSDEECQKIISGLNENWEEGTFVRGALSPENVTTDNSVRKVKIQPYDNSDVINKIIEWIHRTNQQTYAFDLMGIPTYDGLNIMRYDADPENGGGHYTWHMDIGTDLMSCRKISFSVLLSHPADYDGGELEFMPSYPVERQRGAITIFPSFCVHRVAPVKRGTRYALVGWVHGDHYR